MLHDHLYHCLVCIRNRGVERCNICWIDIEGSCVVDDILLIRYQVAYRIAESPYDSVVTLV